MRLLKAIVVLMGLLIVAAATAVGYKLYRGVDDSITTAAGSFATAPVALSAGARVLSMTGDGDALSLLVERADGGQMIVTVDRRTGKVLGRLAITPAD